MQVGHDVLRWVAAVSMVIAAAFGAHAQATKNGDPTAIAAANVEGHWAVKLKLGSRLGDDFPIFFDLHQDDVGVIWGHMVVGHHADFILTGTLKGSQITLWVNIEREGGNDTYEFKGEVKGDVMEGSSVVRDEDGRWSNARWTASRFKPPPERPQ
jgi:hypothetical protein